VVERRHLAGLKPALQLRKPTHIQEGIMLVCSKCQSPRGAYAGGGGNCANCGCDTDIPPHKLCNACSLKLDQCQMCTAPANSGRRPRLATSVTAAERRRDTLGRKAQKVYDRTVAPFRAEVEAFNAERTAAWEDYAVAIKPQQEVHQAAQQRTARLRQANQDISEAQEAEKAAHQELMTQVEKARAIAMARQEAADQKFAPYRATWEAAEKELRTQLWRAERLFIARINQLGGHFGVDAAYKYECQRVMAQER
jgi:hypothetical protein